MKNFELPVNLGKRKHERFSNEEEEKEYLTDKKVAKEDDFIEDKNKLK
jgi:hypothetical protein